MLCLGVACEASPQQSTCAAAHDHEIVVGFIPPREPDTEFSEVLEGDAVPLQFGSQAAWMMVLTLRFPPTLDDDGEIIAAAEIRLTDGTFLSAVGPRRMATVARDDGFRYAPNLFLPLGADDPVLRRFGWDGREADLTVIFTDRCSHEVTVERRVVLVKP